MLRRYGSDAIRLVCTVLVTGLLLTFSLEGTTRAQAVDQPPPTDKQLAEMHCIIGLEKFLPADY